MLKAFFFDIAPWIAYGFFAIAPLIQAWRLYQRKTSQDVSLGYFGLSIAAQMLLVPRLATVTGDTLVLVGHLFSLAAGVFTYCVAVYYRKKNP